MTMNGNELSLGRSHATADSVSMTAGHDGSAPWFRVDIRWNDGAHVYMVHDTESEALTHVHRLGFA
jgi:hypothetical protein